MQQYLSSPVVGLQHLNSASRHNATDFTSQPIQAGKSKLQLEIQQASAVNGINSEILVSVESTNCVAGGADMSVSYLVFRELLAAHKQFRRIQPTTRATKVEETKKSNEREGAV